MVRLRLPPKNAYPHEIIYKEKVKDDDDIWGNGETVKETVLKRTRVDESYDFKRNGVNATDDMPNSLISLFNKYNANMPEFNNQNTVTFNGKELTILAVIPLYLASDEVIGYELEVK
ncbi:putative minor capsid protein [Vagococcus fluvialis]|uniref:putative minor capsid protein n=1 Tax=Vagococcus fluvialis TaxID=2738 RepID=UPI001D0A414A|nr:putative minor capsid protein [Vagococcus fluvialis]UDM79598.1 minor capsid protein [Vagococcus fluvialis]